MKITVLAYVEEETTPAFDVVVEQVAKGLRDGGHTVSILGVHGDLRKLMSGLARRSPDLVFNLVEMFGDNLLGADAGGWFARPAGISVYRRRSRRVLFARRQGAYQETAGIRSY